MSAPVTSKNLYEILGNTHDEDSDKEPEPPTKVADKSLGRSSKRNAPDVAPGGKTHDAPASGGSRRGGAGGSEGAFRDRNAGSSNNRGKSTEEGARQDRQPHRATEGGRGGRGRGGRGRGRGDDRHSQTGKTDTNKQVSQGWGGTKGDSEWNDEKAGEAIAKAEEKEGWGSKAEGAVNADGETLKGDENAGPAAEAEAEPEDNTKSYSEYMAEKAQAKMSELGLLEARKPNEGGKQNKQWDKAKPLQKEEEDEYIAGAGGKAKRERQRKEKTTIDIDQRFVEPTESRGGREGGGSRGRGGRGRGEGRGEYRGSGERGGRGRGGGERGGDRGAYRGSRGGAPSSRGGGRGGAGGAQVNVQDTNAFPSLGGS